MMTGQIRDDDVLVVVDVQTDFLPGGALAVPRGDEVIAPINRLGRSFRHVVLTQDWHPPGHVSFASSHPGRVAFQSITLPYGEQVLWPDHCVQGSQGAALAGALDLPHAELIIRKGCNAAIDSYSGFTEADRRTTTGLQGYLEARGFSRVFVCGLATDYCVGWTACDARRAGFDTIVVEDCCREIDLAGSLAASWLAMAEVGVQRASLAALADTAVAGTSAAR